MCCTLAMPHIETFVADRLMAEYVNLTTRDSRHLVLMDDGKRDTESQLPLHPRHYQQTSPCDLHPVPGNLPRPHQRGNTHRAESRF